MAVAGLIFASFMAIVRHVGSTLDPIQVAFLRYGLGLVFMLPFFLRLNIADFQSARFGLHAIRGVLHAGGVMCWFYAMSRIPIAEVTAIGFTAPVFATIGAALFLGEKVRLRRILAVLIGLLGALIIIRPGIVAIELCIVNAYRGATLCNIRSYVKSINTKGNRPSSCSVSIGICNTYNYDPCLSCMARTELRRVVMDGFDSGFGNFGSPMHGARF